MSKNLPPLRPGLTAIAAVLALSTTPAFAQEAQTAPAQDAPVISAPPPPAATPAPEASPAPLQSTAVDTTTPAPAPAAPAAPMATQSTPVVHQADASADAAPVSKASTPAHAKTAIKASEVKTAAATPASAPVAAPKAAEPASAPAPIVAPKQTETPAPVALAPVAKSTTTTASSTTSNDSREIELAGIGGVALIAIIGGAVALSRRKRDDEDELVLAPATVTTSRVMEEPAVREPVYEPVAAAPVAAVAAPSGEFLENAPTTALHPDFDLSRYGPYVQAAYQGPTEDNPSLSLRHRLKRARFMDQRARENGEYVAPVAAEPMAAKERKPVTQNLISARLKQGLRAVRPQGTMRPAFG